jgi:hypothetical protein
VTRLTASAILVVAMVLIAACEAGADPAPTSSSSTTTTTIDNDTCDRVAEDTVSYLEDLVDTLDATRFDELVRPEEWGSELRDLQRAGKDLDLRVSALRCDVAEIQGRAFSEADLVPGGPLSGRLLELLLTPTTTTTMVETTTSTTSSISTTTDG